MQGLKVHSPKISKYALKIKEFKHEDLIIASILSLSVLWWTRPYNTILYGQDSYNFFLISFRYITNLFKVYGIEQGWITGIGVNNAFTFLVLPSVLSFFFGPPVIERIVLVILIFLQVFGFLRVLGTFDEIRGVKGRSVILKSLASLFYLANVFSLTVTLWHFELWTLPLVVLPYWASSALEILYLDKIRKSRLLQTIGISIFLSPAFSGGWSVEWLILILVTFIMLLFFYLSKRWSLREAVYRFFLLLVLGASTLLWVDVPGYILYFFTTHQKALSASTYIPSFISQAKYFSIYKVLAGLSLSRWPIFDLPSYGWPAGYWNLLSLVSYLIIPIFLVGLFLIKKNRGLLFFYLVSIPVIILSNGPGLPFGPINVFLIRLGGVFLILADAYIFIGGLYIISIAVVIYVLLDASFSSLAKKVSTKNSDEDVNKQNERTSKILRKHSGDLKKGAYIAVLITVFVLISVSAFPLLSSTQFSPKDNNANMFEIPQDLKDAFSYLGITQSEPSSYLLILPMSRVNVYQIELNGVTWPDTSSMLSALSSLPVIDVNSSYYDSQIFNFLWGMNYSDLVPALQFLHIGYVLFNPYFQASAYYFYPGHPFNISTFLNYVYEKLDAEIGPPLKFGTVYLFKIPNPVPLAYPVYNTTLAYSRNLVQYLDFITAFDYNSAGLSPFEYALWTNNSSHSSANPSMNIVKFNGFALETNVTNISQVDLVDENGSINEVWNRTRNLSANSVSIRNSSLLVETNDSRQYDFNFSNRLGKGADRTLFNLSLNKQKSVLVNLKFNNLQIENDSWNYWGIIFKEGNYSFEFAWNENESSNQYYYNLQAFYEGKQYAWDYVHGNNYSYYSTGSDQMRLYMNPDSFNFTFTSLTHNESFNSPNFFYNPTLAQLHDSGYNLSLLEKISKIPLTGNITVRAFFSRTGGNLTSGNVSYSIPYSYAIFVHGNALSYSLINYTLSYDLQGNLLLDIENNQAPHGFYVVLGLKDSPYWEILNGNITSQRLNSDSFYTVFYVSASSSSEHIVLGIDSLMSTVLHLDLIIPLFEIGIIIIYYVYSRRMK